MTTPTPKHDLDHEVYIDPKDQQRYDAENEEYENKLNNPDLNDEPGATASNTGKYR